MTAPQPLDAFELEIADDHELAELTLRFEHRVRFFARRIERRFGLAALWRDDLESAGYWGLLKALQNRRSEAHEHELSAYVSRRVEGAILDESRQILSRLAHHVPWDSSEFDSDRSAEPGEAFTPWTGEAPSNTSSDDPERQADQQGRWRVVEQSLAALDDENRRLLMALASGHSLAEIARQEGATPARLQSRMANVARQVRARAPELRRILRHEL